MKELIQFVDKVKSVYPDATQIIFNVEYDSINRREDILNYKVTQDDITLTTYDQLNLSGNQLHSVIFNFIKDVLLKNYIMISDFEEEEYAFDLNTLEYEFIDNEEG